MKFEVEITESDLSNELKNQLFNSFLEKILLIGE